MYTPAADEKSVTLMIYTSQALIRGNVIAKENVRVNIWLRTDSAPKYFHLVNASMIHVGGLQVKATQYPEMFVPVAMVQAYHLAPPETEPLDYQEDEANRMMAPVMGILGSFLFNGEARISTQTEFGVTIEVARTPWMSLYNVNVSNPFLPQMKIQAPMMMFRPESVAFALQAAA